MFGIGEKSDAKYEEDTKEVINQVREVLDFPMGADGREQSIGKDESVDERVGREVQKIWGLFRQTVVWSHVFRVERGVWAL